MKLQLASNLEPDKSVLIQKISNCKYGILYNFLVNLNLLLKFNY